MLLAMRADTPLSVLSGNVKAKATPDGVAFGVKNLRKLDFEVETSFHAGSTDTNTRTIWNTSPLEVRVYTSVTTRVELGSTNRVAEFSNNLGSFCAEWTDVCHRW